MADDKNKDIAKPKEAGALAVHDYGDDSGKGYENTTQDDYSMPFLSILQALSPQCSGKSKVAGMEEGMLFNTVTESVFDGTKGLPFVPVHREQCFVEWKPRKAGGGYVGRHEMNSQAIQDANNRARNERGQLLTVAGNELVQTAYLYGLIMAEGGPEPIVIAFVSTKLKVYRHFMTKVNQFQLNTPTGKKTPPLFAHQLHLTTVQQSNQHGDFFNFQLTPLNGDIEKSLLDPGSDGYKSAKELASRVQAGSAQANFDSQGAGSSAGAGSGTDDDVPFA